MSSLPDKLRLLADPTRFKILEFLAEPVASCCRRGDGVCGCDLEVFLDLSQPTVSHHMRQLVDAGLVTSERRGRWVYYELAPRAVLELADGLSDLARAGARSVGSGEEVASAILPL